MPTIIRRLSGVRLLLWRRLRQRILGVLL